MGYGVYHRDNDHNNDGGLVFFSAPTGNRTPVSWMRTTCPGPLDDRG